ncbi:MAG: hypothetical protein RBT11_02055 [Desulfobacterales bacterium]|nr:hypothetical protein [Desulfobacterales bacterium]
MKRNISKKLAKRKKKISKRLGKRSWENQLKPMFSSANIRYDIDARHQGIVSGQCLQDFELLRNNKAWLDALQAEIIPDPTTRND